MHNVNNITFNKRKHKIAVVTGGSRGIGLRLCHELLNRDLQVVSGSRSTSFNELGVTEDGITFQALDVRDETSVSRFFNWIHEKLGPVDILINNAGVGVFKSIQEITAHEWKTMIDTNLTGAFLCAKHACQLMQSNGGGRIINMGSVVDTCSVVENSGYSASKAGLKALSGVINEEYKDQQIRSTHVSLGAVHTEIWDDRSGFSKDDMLKSDEVATLIADIALQPLGMRIDTLHITPSKKVL